MLIVISEWGRASPVVSCWSQATDISLHDGGQTEAWWGLVYFTDQWSCV